MATLPEQLTDAEQEYLETLFWLYEVGLPMTGANVSKAMRVSAPAVSEMVGRLERGGYITRDPSRTIAFTDPGADAAKRFVSRHRMIERYLTDVVGVPWHEVHEEAERLEHAMTPRFESYMRAQVDENSTCPHGHPIRVGERLPGVPLYDCDPGAKVTVLRFENEAEDILRYLMESKIEVEETAEVVAKDAATITLRLPGGSDSTLTASVALTVSVAADPSPAPRTALPPDELIIGTQRYGR